MKIISGFLAWLRFLWKLNQPYLIIRTRFRLTNSSLAVSASGTAFDAKRYVNAVLFMSLVTVTED